MTFGSWLRQRRKERGITYEELAEGIGCSRVTIIKLEGGERRPSRQIAELVADFFGIPPDEREPFIAFARSGQTAESPSAFPPTNATKQAPSRAPWRDAYLHKTNLPASLTPLIGREGDTADVRNLLLQPRARLLTMVGPPGIGKTRLALRVAADLLAHFEDGIFLVELAPISDPELVISSVARTLQLKESGNTSIEEVLLAYLHDKRMLLLLDNFEQVLDAALDVVRMLEAGPWLKVMVTSREALHVRGERRYSVPPLTVPSSKFKVQDPSQPVGILSSGLGTVPSVELFVERAQAVAPDFELTPENAGDVAAVCVGLEGMPLAIELAATRVRHFAPSELRAGLDNRLKLLTGGGHDLPIRQRTLRGAIEWSYGLLDSQEQALFRRLGVFVGGFTAAAVDAICKFEADSSWQPSASTLDLLLSLVDKSLVKQESVGGNSGEARFGLLEAIREYADEKLHEHSAREEAELVGRRHALYFMRLVEEAEPSLSGRAKEGDWLTRLDAEHNNLLAALRWSKKSADFGVRNAESDESDIPHSALRTPHSSEVGLRIAALLWRYWYIRGYVTEWQEYLTTALASAPPEGPSQEYRAKALTGAGTLAIWRGDYASARPRFEESLAIRRGLGDKQGVAASLSNLGVMTSMQGDYGTARAFYEESLAIRRELGHTRTDKAGMANLLYNLAELAYAQGEYGTARSLHEEGLALRRELGNKEYIAHALRELGMVVHFQGDSDAARSLLEESLTLQEELGDKMGMTGALSYLGAIASDQGDYDSARSLFRRSLIIRREIGAKTLIAGNLAELGQLTARVGDAYRGARLLGAAAALWEAMSRAPSAHAREVYDNGVASAQAQLGEEAFAQTWAEGRAMPVEDAIEYALTVQDHTVSSHPRVNAHT